MEDITIKEEAAEQIEKIISEEEERPYALRIFVRGGGCSGFEYGFSFEFDGKQEDDPFSQSYVSFIVTRRG